MPWALICVWVLGLVLLQPAAVGTTTHEPSWETPFELKADLYAAPTSGPRDSLDLIDLDEEILKASFQGCEPHPGILISEDEGPQGFEWTHPLTGAGEPRPGSGVTDGSGTEQDPYMIEGWCIGAAGIEITGTSAHVLVRDNTLIGPGVSADAVGILIEDASNVRVEANVVEGFGYGVGSWRSDDLAISENLLQGNLRYGVWTAQTPEVTIRANTAMANENGMGIGFAHHALVSDNIVEKNTVAGIVNAFSDQATLRDNHFLGNDQGVYVREAFDVVVVGNTIDAHTGTGIAFDQSPRGLAQGNLVTQSGHEGIIFWNSPEGVARNNTATGNGFGDDRYGIRMANSIKSTVADNTAKQNANGIALDNSPTSTVRGNLMADNEQAGLVLWGQEETEVYHNSVTRNGLGVLVAQEVEGLAIFANNLWDNQRGTALAAQDVPGFVGATGNWWGCPRGPEQEDCDGVEGDVVFDDWVRTPVQDAPEAPHPGRGRGETGLP